MKASKRRWRQAGFTLVEMLMVIAIVGVLASIAVPKYRNVTMRTRRAEAYAGLSAIYKAQEMYHAEFAEYTDSFDELGVSFDGGSIVDDSTIDGLHYRFQIGTYDLTDVNSNFWATATGDLSPGDGIVDVLLLEPGVTVLE